MRVKRKHLLKLLGFLVVFSVYSLSYLAKDSSKEKTPFQQYVHPHDKFLQGVPFMLDSPTHKLAKKLINELENGQQIESKLSMDILLKTMTPVTAVSTDYNHFNELMKNIQGLKTYRFSQMKLIVYDLGLRKDEIQVLKNDDFIIYRKFHFDDYPEHVRCLKLYTWKPLIIQKVLAERGGVLWMDSSVVFKDNFDAIFHHMVKYQSGFVYFLPPAGHSTISATHPMMLPYFPSKTSQDLKLKMPQATAYAILNTKQIREHIMKWAVLCSLDKDCIAPPDATLNACNDVYLVDKYNGCHRYDQSMLAILVDNAFNGNRTYLIQSEQSKKFVQALRWHPSLFSRILSFFYWYLQSFY